MRQNCGEKRYQDNGYFRKGDLSKAKFSKFFYWNKKN